MTTNRSDTGSVQFGPYSDDRIRRMIEYTADRGTHYDHDISSMLGSLLEERQELTRKVSDLSTIKPNCAGCDELMNMQAQRDVLRVLLTEAEADLYSAVTVEYVGMEAYPNQMRRKERDMDLVRRIRAAIAKGSQA